jgi:hypothetical protein
MLKVNNEIACTGVDKSTVILNFPIGVIHYFVKQYFNTASALLWRSVFASAAAHAARLAAVNSLYVC